MFLKSHWIGGIIGFFLAVFLIWQAIFFFFGWDVYCFANEPVTDTQAEVVCQLLEQQDIDAEFCYNPDKTEITGINVRRPQLLKAKKLALSLDTTLWKIAP